MRIAGIMSGTSMDGINIAIVDLSDATTITTIAQGTLPYPAQTRERILAVSNTTCTTAQISRLNFELGELYTKAVRSICQDHHIPADSLELVGVHGQTVYHEGSGPTPNTLQIGEADIIAERLGIPVVSQFRTRDIAAGGLGAPLVPLADYLLFSHPRIGRVALNIGGIANITMLPAGAHANETQAFDTGPGNMVVDQLVERLTSGQQHYDDSGTIATQAQVNEPLLHDLLQAPYYAQPAPKTAGREQYGKDFVDHLVDTGLQLPDLIATATALTAETIARAIRTSAPWVEQIPVAGGGVHNQFLVSRLAALLPGVHVASSAEFGVHPDAREAIAFAVLAHRTWHRRTGNLPSATGAHHPVILGKVSF